MSVAKFSIIIPALNEEKFLPKLLASLTSQTQKNFEVIVVDGRSTDNTVQLAKNFSSKLANLKVLVASKASLPLQRNLGAQIAKGEWLVFVDADSVLLPYFFERIAFFIAQENPSVFTTWCRPDTEDTNTAIFTLIGNLMFEASIKLNKPLTPGPLTIVKKEIFDLIGGYDEDHAFQEDMDLGLRLQKRAYQLKTLKETLFVLSLRRLRKEGTLKVAQQYVAGSLPVLLFNRTFKSMPGYTMGGQIYNRKIQSFGRSMLKIYEAKLKALVKEFFA